MWADINVVNFIKCCPPTTAANHVYVSLIFFPNWFRCLYKLVRFKRPKDPVLYIKLLFINIFFTRRTLVQFRALCTDPVLSGFLPGLLFKISTFGLDFHLGKHLIYTWVYLIYSSRYCDEFDFFNTDPSEHHWLS